MKNSIKTLTLVSFSCLALGVANAQEKNAAKGKMGEFDEIVIKRKSGKDGKITVEIKDDNILIDGRKLEQFSNPDISVFRRHITPMNGNNFSFNDGSGRSFDFLNDNDDEENVIPAPVNKAMLGVITEKTTATGATVKTVAKGSAAEKAGIRPGDIITKVDNDVINEPAELFETIGNHEPGDKVTVTYLRNKKENKAIVKLEERKISDSDAGISPLPMPRNRGEMFLFPPVPRGRQGFDDRGWFSNAEEGVKLGIQVQDTDNGDGALVINISPDSPGEKAGFKIDDLITSMAGNPVKSAHDVAVAYRTHRSKGTITATIKRNGQEQTVEIKVPKRLNKADL
ncbi:PDZ domain-containing protein [Chitinophaga solisilvae]|uniref:PDZ domain-containing protein n=1 Tax=Chitinophaga solisilvae TaxID=1233460 RepID=UPI00136D518F|nr:PDZ domain-containing protein [Chitinophaga solisilvae]